MKYKNKIIDALVKFEKKHKEGGIWIFISLCGLISFFYIVIGSIFGLWEVAAQNHKYTYEICESNKCKARVERLNECNWNIKCAVKLTQEASYNYLHIELTNLKEKSIGTEKVIKKQQVFNLDKLAYAVAMQETKDCTLGYWKTHNNCFWIKHGNTVPCPWVPKMAMCKFKTKEESYEAFKIIWTKWYWELPNYEMAKRWSGDDRAGIWKYNVLHFYNK